LGQKTQTRRSTERKRGRRVYEIGDRVGIQPGYKPPVAYVIFTSRCKQEIGDITEEDARKEGFANVEEFKQAWLKLYDNWDSTLEVWVYDFVLEKQSLLGERSPTSTFNVG
jgi:hypothetical protein